MELRLEQTDYADSGVYRLILERPPLQPIWGWAPYIYEITGYNVVDPRRNVAESTYAVKPLLVTPYPDRCVVTVGRLKRPGLLEAGEGKTGWRQRYCLHFAGKDGFLSKIDTPLLDALIDAKLIVERLERAAREDAGRQEQYQTRALMDRAARYLDNFGRPYIPNERPVPAPRRPAIPVQEVPKIKRRCFFDE